MQSNMNAQISINADTPLMSMTAGQLAEYLDGILKANTGTRKEPARAESQRRFVYGLKGIMGLFGVSNVTAQRYKNGIIKDAVSQCGRKIVVDADRALELFRESREEEATNLSQR